MKIDDSYKEMLHSYPPPVLIEIAREEWDRTYVIYARNIDPMCNTVGLYWRLTGIGKEQLDRMPQHSFPQMNQMEDTGSMRFAHSLFGLSGLLGPGASASDLNTPVWLQEQLQNFSTPKGK